MAWTGGDNDLQQVHYLKLWMAWWDPCGVDERLQHYWMANSKTNLHGREDIFGVEAQSRILDAVSGNIPSSWRPICSSKMIPGVEDLTHPAPPFHRSPSSIRRYTWLTIYSSGVVGTQLRHPNTVRVDSESQGIVGMNQNWNTHDQLICS